MYKQARAGLYVQKSTRSRLNLFKAQYAMKHGRRVSQSDAIDALLDLAGIARPAAPQTDGLPDGMPNNLPNNLPPAALPIRDLPLRDLRSERPAA